MSAYDSYVGTANGAPRRSIDAVNLPAIRRFVEAMGDTNPVYVDDGAARAHGRAGIVAPPAMLSVWVAKGLRDTIDEQSEPSPVLQALARAGFTVTPGTNLLHRFHRELVLGDVLTQTTLVAAVSDRKRTPLGPAHFVTLRSEYTDAAGNAVAEQVLTVAALDPLGERAASRGHHNHAPTGDGLAPLAITLDRLGVIACTTACSDFRAGHYDPDVAVARGFRDIFTDIPTSTAFVSRYVTDSYGPAVRIESITVRLGVPFYAGDTLTLRGHPVGRGAVEPGAVEPGAVEPGAVEPGAVEVTGDTSNGRHLTARVEFVV